MAHDRHWPQVESRLARRKVIAPRFSAGLRCVRTRVPRARQFLMQRQTEDRIRSSTCAAKSGTPARTSTYDDVLPGRRGRQSLTPDATHSRQTPHTHAARQRRVRSRSASEMNFPSSPASLWPAASPGEAPAAGVHDYVYLRLRPEECFFCGRSRSDIPAGAPDRGSGQCGPWCWTRNAPGCRPECAYRDSNPTAMGLAVMMGTHLCAVPGALQAVSHLYPRPQGRGYHLSSRGARLATSLSQGVATTC